MHPGAQGAKPPPRIDAVPPGDRAARARRPVRRALSLAPRARRRWSDQVRRLGRVRNGADQPMGPLRRTPRRVLRRRWLPGDPDRGADGAASGSAQAEKLERHVAGPRDGGRALYGVSHLSRAIRDSRDLPLVCGLGAHYYGDMGGGGYVNATEGGNDGTINIPSFRPSVMFPAPRTDPVASRPLPDPRV